jgi:hypothetical protein
VIIICKKRSPKKLRKNMRPPKRNPKLRKKHDLKRWSKTSRRKNPKR